MKKILISTVLGLSFFVSSAEAHHHGREGHRHGHGMLPLIGGVLGGIAVGALGSEYIHHHSQDYYEPEYPPQAGPYYNNGYPPAPANNYSPPYNSGYHSHYSGGWYGGR